jgi:hypothetical protein
MTDAHSKRRKAYGGAVLIVVCILTALSAASAAALTPPADTDPAITEIKARLDRLEKESSINNDLKDVKQKLDTIADTRPAPWEAWLAVGVVGALFVVKWASVSSEREASRIREAEIHKDIAINAAQTKANEAEVGARLDAVIDLLKRTRSETAPPGKTP